MELGRPTRELEDSWRELVSPQAGPWKEMGGPWGKLERSWESHKDIWEGSKSVLG